MPADPVPHNPEDKLTLSKVFTAFYVLVRVGPRSSSIHKSFVFDLANNIVESGVLEPFQASKTVWADQATLFGVEIQH